MTSKTLHLKDNRFELLTDGDTFLGLGAIHIGQTQVRSGRLPLRVCTQTFTGLELAHLRLLEIIERAAEIRIRLAASFQPLPVKLMKDHSFDPIHDLTDWDAPREAGAGQLEIVLRPASDRFNGIAFSGFSYHYEYESDSVPLFYLLDKASWELDDNIVGATVVSQSSCSDPLVTFAEQTAWSTEGLMHWDLSHPNPVMTHNLPRWASHQAFDFQFKGSKTLLGVFERVDLIRSVLQREADKAELKTFDKHIFDQAKRYATSPKKILLNADSKSETDQRNVWTWVFDEVHDRARAEFGLAEEPMVPRLSANYWHSFTVDSYFKDLLPAAIGIGVKQLFVDNLKKSAMTDRTPFPGKFTWNMCCGHEYEIAPELGGTGRVKDFVAACRKHGIRVMSWTNNTQALSSPINEAERDEKGWFVRMEDTRLKYGGAYSTVLSALDVKNPDARKYFVESHVKIKELTGLDGYLFDSFYNLGFMPVNYHNGKPTTMWRELATMFKELQDAGVSFLIESFGPWGQPQHGCPRSYSIDRCWVVYKVGLGNDYTTIPSGKTYEDPRANEAAGLYYTLAHKTCPPIPLFRDGKRVDEFWTDTHKQALADYNEHGAAMERRYLQEDGLAVLWHDEKQKLATVWNFADRKLKLPGKVRDMTTGEALPRSSAYKLKALHTYSITGVKLPTTLD